MSKFKDTLGLLASIISIEIPRASFDYKGQRMNVVTVGVGPLGIWALGGGVFGLVIVPLAVFDVARFLIEKTF